MPKLTLRDLFAVVTIVALALGWWLDHRRQRATQVNLQSQRDELKSIIESPFYGGTVTFEDDGGVRLGRDLIRRPSN